jgi:hypothetical protein
MSNLLQPTELISTGLISLCPMVSFGENINAKYATNIVVLSSLKPQNLPPSRKPGELIEFEAVVDDEESWLQLLSRSRRKLAAENET